jgi:hypothetical protein
MCTLASSAPTVPTAIPIVPPSVVYLRRRCLVACMSGHGGGRVPLFATPAPRRGSWGLALAGEVRRDRAEGVADAGLQAGEGRDQQDRDEGDDQGVLDEALAFLVFSRALTTFRYCAVANCILIDLLFLICAI